MSWNHRQRLLQFLLLVTLHMSVWVEIFRVCMVKVIAIVTLHVSVWVEIWIAQNLYHCFASRSTWACELKSKIFKILKNIRSHAPRERVSWNYLDVAVAVELESHAPRERVSWNLLWLQVRLFVTCHAPRERVSQFSFQRRTYRYWIIQITAPLRRGGIFIPKYYTFFMCFPSNPPIHTLKFVQTNDL